MHPVIYYMIIFAVLGGIGMAVANRKAEVPVRRQRWIKYFMYILITGTIITGILLHIFYWLSWIIVLASFAEMCKVNYSFQSKTPTRLLSFIIFLPVAAGFIFFAQLFAGPFLLFIYFQVLVFDGFCQVTGQLLGRHPISLSISPSKTWEGLAGGWICCIAAALLAMAWLKKDTTLPYFGFLSGLFTGLIAFIGDLAASYYKRKLKVKDYSNWLPGQGGFLDRFDSFLLTGSIYYLLYITVFKQELAVFIN
jgi:phosphatidate cytidylyltransferase